MNESTGTQKNGNKSKIIIGFLLIIVIIQFIKIYTDSQQRIELKKENTTTEKELSATLQRLNEIQFELEEKIAEIEKLGGDITELEKAKKDIERQLAIRTKATGNLIQELKSKVEGYEQLLKLKDVEIEKLKTVNQQLLTENTSLKTQKNKLGDSITRIEQKRNELESKVVIASQLKAEFFKIVSLSNRNRERNPPFKARQVDKLKIEFSIAENKVAPIEGKKIMIRIVDPNGHVLYDVDRGSGTFLLDNKEEFYTAAQEILFDNSKQRLSFIYENTSEYIEGIHSIEVYTEGYLMGKGQFEIK